MKISYGKNVYGAEEINSVVSQLKKTTQMGASVNKFEALIAKKFSKKYGLMVNSGSSALTLAMSVLGVNRNDEIIVPCLNFGTAISSIIQAGAKPILVDVEVDTLQIDVSEIEKKITNKTVAIMVPNLIGNIPDLKKIKIIATKHNLRVVEDSADTLGARIGNKTTGFYSDISITSFYGSHIINCAGNGGALAINNEKVMEKAKLLRSWGRSSSLFDEKSESIENRFNVDLDGIDYDAKFVFEKIGYNLEGNEVGAAFGLAQLEKLNTNIKIRRENFNRQCDFFSKYPNYFSNPEEIKGSQTAWLAFPLLIKKNAPFKRKEMQIYLEKQNIQTRVVFTGNVMRQPMCNGINFKAVDGGCPNADEVMRSGILLPVHHGLTEKMFNRFYSTIDKFISEYC